MSVIPATVREGIPIADARLAFRDQVSFVFAAANLYGNALAAAAPGGSLDAPTCQSVGRGIALRGWFTGLISTDGDGEPTIEPADLWINNGVWTGTTRPLSGEIGVTVSAPDAAVLNVRLPDGRAPVSRLNPLARLGAALDGALADEADVPVLRLVGLDMTMATATAPQRGEIDLGIDQIVLQGRRYATVAAGVEQSRIGVMHPAPDRGAVELRSQLRADVEAAYGLQGLLSESGSTEIHGYWRVATVRTFEPLALLVEAEAARKLDGAARFDRSKWIAAPVSEVARERAQRATAVQRLVAAGVDVERAIRLAGLDG